MNSFSLSIQVPQITQEITQKITQEITQEYLPSFQPLLLRQNAYVRQNALQTAYVNKNWLFTHFDEKIIYDNRKTLYTWNDVVLTPDELNQDVMNAVESV
jgi:hypothetical protein